MSISLGIDTGGTYTDAVLFDHASNSVLSSAKVLTTRCHLFSGISNAITAVCNQNKGTFRGKEITLVSLSTTLATNAVTEGYGSKVCLILIGYNQKMMDTYGFQKKLETDDIVHISGGHTLKGDEIAPLDEEAVRKVILAKHKEVEAFAISGYFGTRNPAHEKRARQLAEKLSDLPVTCGHELTTRLNSIQRAVTVTLNARLIPILHNLIADVERTLVEYDIDAPLMVVKGDGSMVNSEWAARHPIETIISGPAASAIGAAHLTGYQNALVVDVGGTTTDIAFIDEGRPRLNTEGAFIGGRRTLVEAVDVYTVGRGGDSHVDFNRDKKLTIGPKRVVPLSLLGAEHPEILKTLRYQEAAGIWEHGMSQFFVAGRSPNNGVGDEESAVLAAIKKAPIPLLKGLNDRDRFLRMAAIRRLESKGLILRSGFTPTDALHALGIMKIWNGEAARLGAEMLAAYAGLCMTAFCRFVVQRVEEELLLAIIGKATESMAFHHGDGQTDIALNLLKLATGHPEKSELGCTLSLHRPLIAIGAPVKSYMKPVAKNLNTDLIVPEHGEVANAVGAVCGGIVQRRKVIIGAIDGAQEYRAHLPDGVHDFLDLEEAVSYVHRTMSLYMKALAEKAGAEKVAVQMKRLDHTGRFVAGSNETIFLDTELVFTAAGRPAH
jgi:N-methylhydantoinase A/oxoprolinase/acetone carboxylase beta subunit